MLTLRSSGSSKTCDGFSRRDFLRIGSLGMGSLSLPQLLQAREAAGGRHKNTSVVWLWLGGGATHIETFNPLPDAPAEYRSSVGVVNTAIPGVVLGGLFPSLGACAKDLAIVRSFTHGNAGHSGGTHWVMTGYNHPPADQGLTPIKPSFGSITARFRGPNNRETGLPSLVSFGGIYSDGPAFLGAQFAPFQMGGEAQSNMENKIDVGRFDDRRQLLNSLDGASRDHWPQAITLLLSGGGLRMRQVIGETNYKGEYPKNDAVTPQDLMATIFHVLGIDPALHYEDQAGRPQPMLYGGKIIPGLV